ncbi:MAG TPA: 4-(cytidine 5'-diphospho)-2-C-methyl-D-erythritol kinase [Chthoniobacterales bacterium]|nr:4-(cytidine 5'-diphospho)-2-C-methyl-D-erythritol kinase [Chthoniobacterales bacterium]
MQLRAPAKINLSLKIDRRRSDGFHEIETLMAPISLGDELTLTRTNAGSDIRFTCDDPTLPTSDDNLALRAARLFLRETKLRGNIGIELRKKIPHGAGLAGGSSDAATVLLGLDRMFETALGVDRLTTLAASIGSDVPFFILESAALCRGRGELVHATALARGLRLLLLKPAFGVPTPWAYGRWKDSKEWPDVAYGPQEFAGYTFQNDLERPVFEKFVFLARMKMWLLAQVEVGAALMSGSGSTLFAVLRDGADAAGLAERAKAELDPELWTCAGQTL